MVNSSNAAGSGGAVIMAGLSHVGYRCADLRVAPGLRVGVGREIIGLRWLDFVKGPAGL